MKNYTDEKRLNNFLAEVNKFINQYHCIFTNENTNDLIKIGNKNNRKCRFCGLTENNVKFKDVAHAIPESLGNKNIILYDECDVCNHEFGENIETHFDKIVKIYKHIGQIKGKKNKVPSLKSYDKKFRSDVSTNRYIIDSSVNPKVTSPKDNQLMMNIDVEPYIPSAVYKCLVKIALSIMPEELLGNFKDSIFWIKDKSHKKNILEPLYILRKFYSGPRPIEKPTVWLFINKDHITNETPFCIFVLAFGNTKMQITLALT